MKGKTSGNSSLKDFLKTSPPSRRISPTPEESFHDCSEEELKVWRSI